MAISMMVFLTALAVALLKLADYYRSRDKYPPLPSVPADPVDTSPIFTQYLIQTAMNANAPGLETPGHCHSAHGSLDIRYGGESGTPGQNGR
jgi:hypothetical protein